MALFDGLINDIAARFGLGASAGPLVREILNMVTSSPGGIGGFLDKLNFRTALENLKDTSGLGDPEVQAL